MAVLLAAPSLPAKNNNRAAQKLYKQGQAAEQKSDWDTAVAMYQKALDASPTDLTYEIAMRRARFQSGQKHVADGVKLREAGKLPEAIEELEKAIVTDPSSAVAIQELKRTQQVVLDQNRQSSLTGSGLTATEKLRKEEEARIASIESPPELRPTLRRLPSPMKMNGMPPQQLFRTVAMLAGLYVDFDPTYQPPMKPFDVNLDGLTVEQAFDEISFVTHTYWKPISSNTIFVCEDNTTKRRDYEDEVARVFYVPNASTVQEFQEIANGIRTITEIRRLFTYNAGRAIMVRGTADQVALVEKLVNDLDKPKAEVIVDVKIMEANSTRSRTLAATIASAGTAGLNVPISFTPRSSIQVGSTSTTNNSSTNTNTNTGTPGFTPGATSTGATPGAVGLNSLSHIASADFSTSLPGALLEAILTDTRTKVLNSPQIRASDGAKAELQVGLRIPYATGSLGSAVGATTVGVSPLVQTQFSYADTGVQLVIQPQVHSADELTMHVEITVSSVQQYENLGGGISQPVISQEKSITDVRMRNNEVSLLGGLNQATDSSTVNGIPGLTDIPVLGKVLFGSQNTEKDSNQLLIAMTPHIVRTPDYSPENLRAIFAGSDANVKIVHAAPAADQAPAATPAPIPPAVPVPAAPVQPQAAAPAPPAAPGADPSKPVASTDAASEAGARLSFLPGPVQVAKNGSFTLAVQMDGAADVASVPLRIKYDPSQVRLNNAEPGNLLTRDGGQLTTIREIHNESGEATVTLARLPGSKGVFGSGVVAKLTFSAVGKGSGDVSIAGAELKNSQSQRVPAELASVPVTVE